jgi:calcium/calmodulin-dependent protein kinase I
MGGGLSSTKTEDIASIYRFEEKLGEGSFAIVKRGILLQAGRNSVHGRPIPETIAIKTIDKKTVPDKDLPLLKDEVDIMYRINHPNCVAMYEMFDNDQELHLILEELSGGELFDHVVNKGYFTEQEASDVIKQITCAIQYLHAQGVVHRDLKPENVLYASDADDAEIKVTDFGLAKYLDEDSRDEFNMKTACGTPGYVAPEVLSGKAYGKEVDLWSTGVILYILLCGFPPFYSENQVLLFKQIKSADFQFASPYWDDISQEAKDVVNGLLVVDPTKRLTSEQLLEMPWIKNRGPSGDAGTRQLGTHVLEGLKKVQAQQRWLQAKNKIVLISRLTGAPPAMTQSRSNLDLKAMEQAEAEMNAGLPRRNSQGDVKG